MSSLRGEAEAHFNMAFSTVQDAFKSTEKIIHHLSEVKAGEPVTQDEIGTLVDLLAEIAGDVTSAIRELATVGELLHVHQWTEWAWTLKGPGVMLRNCRACGESEITDK